MPRPGPPVSGLRHILGEAFRRLLMRLTATSARKIPAFAQAHPDNASPLHGTRRSHQPGCAGCKLPLATTTLQGRPAGRPPPDKPPVLLLLTSPPVLARGCLVSFPRGETFRRLLIRLIWTSATKAPAFAQAPPDNASPLHDTRRSHQPGCAGCKLPLATTTL